MKVFISWSGDISRALAVELRDWLPMAVHQVDAWISGRDIDPGRRWALVLGHELATSDFAIIVLTRDNLTSPWILFEAGAVARSLEAHVVPLLFGISPSDLDGPFAQFQSIQADRRGVERVVSLLYEVTGSELDADQRELVFNRLWPVFEERVDSLHQQYAETEDVESPEDLVDSLEKSADKKPDAPVDAKVIELLRSERERLRRQLEYLNAEEEKLTKQDAPISLLDRAIIPSEERLERVESTIDTALDMAVAGLTPSQIDILRQLVTPLGLRQIAATEVLGRHTNADFRKLAQLGLVALDKHGASLVHDLVAAYVLKKYGPA